MVSRAFAVVASFEEAMAEYAGARYGVAVETCSAALFLSCLYRKVDQLPEVVIPSRTYISVPAAIIHAGGRVRFVDEPWVGAYRLEPTDIVDSALRMRRGMYEGGLHCVSFHMRKHLPIGRGGMVLTDWREAAVWLRKARFDGREGATPFLNDPVALLGWNFYMLPEQAARGLQLLEALPDAPPDLTPEYPDLSRLPVFALVPA
jgi:dTDP-4-amino-4,6-dideoxygalactose transaminase